MTNSRLLHAAARGARIQTGSDDDWVNSSPTILESVKDFAKWYRIHPDDLALQYGPISTALRDIAEFGYVRSADAVAIYSAHEVKRLLTIWAPMYSDDEDDNRALSLSLLFMAEALADEGL